jgi:hypothetical protein
MDNFDRLAWITTLIALLMILAFALSDIIPHLEKYKITAPEVKTHRTDSYTESNRCVEFFEGDLKRKFCGTYQVYENKTENKTENEGKNNER